MRSEVRIVRRGRIEVVRDFAPTTTLLDYLRLSQAARGTKEGCNEGDCGACTVAVGSLVEGRVVYSPVNACIRFVGQLDGCEVVTVEDLGTPGNLHPLQRAMVEHHGSQCGFCTPGIVMSLFTLYHSSDHPATHADVTGQLQGNLCRCTGYRPIIEAARAAITGRPDDAFTRNEDKTAALLKSLDDGEDLFVGDDTGFFAAPASEAGVAALYLAHPDATIVAGATDVGLWVTKQLRHLPKIIHIGKARDMRAIRDDGEHLVLGAAATYAEAGAALGGIDADVATVLSRIGSRQVRASGTVGGNIANGSPIGDTPPMLIALGAMLTLRRGDVWRSLPLEAFFLAYGRQERASGEIVSSVSVPHLRAGQHFRAYKASKRFDQDISAVMGAFLFTIEDGRIGAARIAFGGMAATPKRAMAAETALVGVPLSEAARWLPAIAALGADYAPLSDMRASAAYRLRVARAMLQKALYEISSGTTRLTRVTGWREEVA